MTNGLRFSEDEVKRMQQRLKLPKKLSAPDPVFTRQSGNKYRNVICEADHIKFPSKKHRQHYLLLKALQQAGEIRFFLREIPFDLPGHYENGRVIRHYVDFAVCQNDGSFRWAEVKGRDLAIGKLKRAQVEEIYDIKIEVI